MGVNFNIETPQGQDFLEYFCEYYPTWVTASSKVYVVYNSAKFIDIMNILYTTIQGSKPYDPILDLVNPDTWKTNLQALVSEFFNQYNENNDKYSLWLIDQNIEFTSRYQEMYHGIFYKTGSSYLPGEALNLLEEDFEHNIDFTAEIEISREELFLATNSAGCAGMVIGATISFAEQLTETLYNACENAYTANTYSEEDKQELYDLLTQHPQKLYDFYFNPAASGIPVMGYTATELAEKVSEFLMIFTDDPYYSEDPLVYFDQFEFENNAEYHSDIKRVYSGTTNNFDNAVDCGDKVLVEAGIPEIANLYSTIIFSLKKCDYFKSYIVQFPHNSKTVCECHDMISVPEGDVSTTFFERVYNVILENPSILERSDCNPPCENKVLYEHAFVTMTRMREKNLNEVINNTILAVEIASLPFSFLELIGAHGAHLIFRGIIFATELESVVITVSGNGDFEEGCQEIFGENFGTTIAPYLNVLNALTSGADLLHSLGSSLTSLRFGKNQLIEAEAAAKYAADYESLAVVPVGEIDKSKQYRSLENQISNNLKLNGIDDSESLIYYNKFYGIDIDDVELSALKDNDKFKEMILKYRKMQKNDNVIHESITDFMIEGLSEPQKTRLVSQLNGEYGEEIMDEIVDSFNEIGLTNSQKIVRSEKKAKNYRRLVESVSDVCQ